MKFVINRCYGGFSLSKEAVQILAERGFEPCIQHLQKMPKEEFYFDSSDNKSITLMEFRSHEQVVSIVEELGQKAFGRNAKLKIVDVPTKDPNMWRISDYDGMEKIIIEESLGEYY